MEQEFTERITIGELIMAKKHMMYDEDPEDAEVFAERVSDLCDRTDEFSDDELRDELMDAYELIEDILNGVAY